MNHEKILPEHKFFYAGEQVNLFTNPIPQEAFDPQVMACFTLDAMSQELRVYLQQSGIRYVYVEAEEDNFTTTRWEFGRDGLLNPTSRPSYRVFDLEADQPRSYIAKQMNPTGHSPHNHRRDEIDEELRLLQTITHPHIIHPEGVAFDTAGNVYMLTEYIPGENYLVMAEFLDNPLELAQHTRSVLEVLTDLTENFGYTHNELKPEHIRFASKNSRLGREQHEIKILLDFEAAQRLKDGQTERPAALATPPYASPEQMAGKLLTPADDTYAVGVILYAGLTGQAPRSFMNPNSKFNQFRFDSAPLELRPSMKRYTGTQAHEILSIIVRKATQQLDINRFQTARQFDQALAEVC